MSSKLRAYAITDNNVTVNLANGQTHIIARTDALADKLIKALREGRSDEIADLVSASKRVEKYGKGNFKVVDGVILINGQAVPDVLSRKILRFQADGLPYQPLVKFAENLQKNPSYRSVNELFQFLEKNDHPITENGNFIAYKKVRVDFKDVHTGTFDNSPGVTVEMNRNQVNEDSSQTCSSGLHVANFDYATNFYNGGLMLECEVNPADVVSIPADYNQSKMRVCRYKVLGTVDCEHSEDLGLRVTSPSYVAPEEEDEEVYECEDCGEETDGQDVCDDCDYQRDLDAEEEEEEEDDEDDEDDEYPWKDELDE